MNKSTLWLGRLGLLALSSTLALYACEAALRMLYVLPAPLANHYPVEAAKLGKVVRVQQKEFEIEYRYNAQGFRGPDITPKQEGVKRLLFVGDSFVEGFGVEERERFSDRTARALGPGYEAINVGQLATNPYVYLDNIEEFGIALQPDVIIMGFFLGNDFMGGRMLPLAAGHRANLRISLGKEKDSWAPLRLEYVRTMWNQVHARDVRLVRKQEVSPFWELFFKEPVTKELYARLFKLTVPELEEAVRDLKLSILHDIFSGRMHTGMFEEAVNRRLKPEEDIRYIEEDYVKTLACIQEADRLSRTHGIPFMVVLIPDISGVHPHQFREIMARDFHVTNFPLRLEQLVGLRERLRQDLTRQRIAFVDTTDALKRSESLTYYLYDNHMNSHGHAIVSETLLPVLRQLLSP